MYKVIYRVSIIISMYKIYFIFKEKCRIWFIFCRSVLHVEGELREHVYHFRNCLYTEVTRKGWQVTANVWSATETLITHQNFNPKTERARYISAAKRPRPLSDTPTSS